MDKIINLFKKDHVKGHISNTFWLNFTQVISGIAVFLFSYFVAKYIDKNTYGTYKYLLSTLSVFGAFGLSGIGVAITRTVARGYKNALYYGSIIYLKFSIISFGISSCAGLYYLVKGNGLFGWFFIIGGLIYPFMTISQFYNYYLLGKKDFKQYSFYALIPDIVPPIILTICIFAFQNIYSLLIAYIASTLICNGIFFIKTIKVTGTGRDENFEKEMSHQAKHLSLNNLMSGIVGQIDKFLVFQFIGPAQLASYTFSIAIPDFIKPFVKNINTVFFPTMTQSNSKSHLKKIMLVTIGSSILLALLIVFSYAISANFIFKTLFPNYIEAVYPSIIYSVTILLIGLQNPITTLFQAKAKNSLLHKNTSITSVFQLLILFIGIYLNPTILGMIYSRILGQLASSIITITQAKKAYDQSLIHSK